MLTLILGRAGSGKTAHIMDEIKRRADTGETGLYLLVPEQYSHDAERQLCKICGDKLSLHGEAISFSRMCSRVFAETGGAALTALDAGGQILIMRRALDAVSPNLRVFGAGSLKTELLEKLLAAAKEFKSLSVTPERLAELSEFAGGPLGDKLYDLSVILAAFDAFFGESAADPSGRLDRLAEKLGESTIGDAGHIYFDGFNDYTAQELRVIGELMKKNAALTVCLTCGGLHGDDEIFDLPRKTTARLLRLAETYGLETEIIEMDAQGGRAEELRFLEKHLFDGAAAEYTGECGAVELYAAPTMYTECEYAAHKVWELVRSGYRWRDIGVMARDWAEYGPVCGNVFEKYGVQFFSGGRSDILQKPPAALIDAALEIVTSGWEYHAVFKYLKTDLTGVVSSGCAELENYVLKWKIRGTAWTRAGDWALPPSGFGSSEEAERGALLRINELRRQITQPLECLHSGVKGVSPAGEKLKALYDFFEDIELPKRLAGKAELLDARGERRLADEYEQLWDIIINAMEQFYAILGDTSLSGAEFRRMFSLVLSQYGVGVIPVALDRTVLGDMQMSRRRDLKCLIVLGASDGDLPRLTPGGGVFSVAERDELIRLGADMPAGQEDRLCREMNMIYSTLTLPSHKLILTYPTSGGGRASFIVKRLRTMFGIREITLREEEYMTASEHVCFELASMSGNAGAIGSAARQYFAEVSHEAASRLEATDRLLRLGRGRLSSDMAIALYGRELSLSASRVDRFYSCSFAHFLQNGLRLSPRVPAGFDAPAAGTFMHFVLENVTKEIKRTAGFRNADDGLIRSLTAQYIGEYVKNALYNLEGRDARFRFLFDRLAEDTMRLVPDMMEELKISDFEPLDFELDFSELAGGHDGMKLRGIVDRVDGWRHNGKLFLRVIDYKTGKKPFSLSDIMHGMGMQMLIYLFTLRDRGGERYGCDTEAAGALYIPARDVIVKAPRNTPDSELIKLREKELRRSGLILNDGDVLEAMENGEKKKYLPVKTTKDGYGGDGIASRGQLALLSEHVGNKLRQAGDEILGGGVNCEPYYKNAADNACIYCVYRAACAFCEDMGDRRRYIQKLSAGEVWETLEGGRGE